MKAVVKWQGGMTFSGSANTGFSVPMGAHPDVGGDNDGFRPLELLAVGLAGCTAMDVISILRKKRQQVKEFEVQAIIEQQESHPHVFTSVLLNFVFQGKSIDPKAVERSIELSYNRYCPASAMLSKAVKIETAYEIIEISA